MIVDPLAAAIETALTRSQTGREKHRAWRTAVAETAHTQRPDNPTTEENMP